VPHAANCWRILLTGEVNAGQEWKQPFGQGWLFRVVPIQPGHTPGTPVYSGWDLVVDRDPSAGYPDALLVATPPYYSISEREVATTFGLRAQDAIGWNPRSFHFLTDSEALHEGQKEFRALGGTKIWTEKAARNQSPVISGRVSNLECEADSGDCRCRPLRPEMGASVLEDTAYDCALHRNEGYAFWRTRMDAVFHHAVVAGGMEDTKRAWRGTRRLFGMMNAVKREQE
jgi:hypothetical protein